MCDLRKLARIILIGLGVYILLFAAFSVIISLPLWVLSEFNVYGLVTLISVLLLILFYFLVIFLLFKKADSWADKIAGSGEQNAKPYNVNWIPVAFRLAAVFAGICILFWTIPNIIWMMQFYVTARLNNLGTVFDFVNVERSVGFIIELALGVYLIWGAPHFVRWHVKKTMEQFKGDSETGLQQDG